jgi:hypothetical protein
MPVPFSLGGNELEIVDSQSYGFGCHGAALAPGGDPHFEPTDP